MPQASLALPMQHSSFRKALRLCQISWRRLDREGEQPGTVALDKVAETGDMWRHVHCCSLQFETRSEAQEKGVVSSVRVNRRVTTLLSACEILCLWSSLITWELTFSLFGSYRATGRKPWNFRIPSSLTQVEIVLPVDFVAIWQLLVDSRWLKNLLDNLWQFESDALLSCLLRFRVNSVKKEKLRRWQRWENHGESSWSWYT